MSREVPRPIRFSFAISKVGMPGDTEERIVEGWATAECIDKQGDIVPFDVAVAAFERGASMMGVREMHLQKAVAALQSWWPDPENKRIGIRVFIPETTAGNDVLTNCRAGVYKGFSIGGLCTQSHMERVA